MLHTSPREGWVCYRRAMNRNAPAERMILIKTKRVHEKNPSVLKEAQKSFLLYPHISSFLSSFHLVSLRLFLDVVKRFCCMKGAQSPRSVVTVSLKSTVGKKTRLYSWTDLKVIMRLLFPLKIDHYVDFQLNIQSLSLIFHCSMIVHISDALYAALYLLRLSFIPLFMLPCVVHRGHQRLCCQSLSIRSLS